jgi:hypothetical protein
MVEELHQAKGLDGPLYGCTAGGLGVIWRVWAGTGPCPECLEEGRPVREIVDTTEDWAPAAHVDMEALGFPTVERLKQTHWYQDNAARNLAAVEAEHAEVRARMAEENR